MPNKNKSEIEGRLRKLSLVDNIITLNEAKEKLDVLSKNADILKGKLTILKLRNPIDEI